MNIFLIGGTGVIGRRLIPMLVSSGYCVNVLCRSEDNVNVVTKLGGNPVIGDIYNKEQLIQISAGNGIFMHMATAIPTKTKVTHEDWQSTMRLRTEAVENLIEAAIMHKCKFYLQQSTIFGFGDRQGRWVDETTETQTPVIGIFPLEEQMQKVSNNILVMEKIVNRAISYQNLNSCLLRFGWFYSHDSTNISSFFKRQYRIINGGKSYISLIHVDDAVTAIIAAVKNYSHCISRTIHIVDDEPVMWRDLLNYSSNLSTGKNAEEQHEYIQPNTPGASQYNFLLNSCRVRNDLAKKILNWKPKYRNYKNGLDYEFLKFEGN